MDRAGTNLASSKKRRRYETSPNTATDSNAIGEEANDSRQDPPCTNQYDTSGTMKYDPTPGSPPAALCSSANNAAGTPLQHSRCCAHLGKQSTLESAYTEQERRVRVVQSARKEHEINVEALRARISIGERGLGSLARQLHDIQIAIKLREDEIRRLELETEAEEAAKRRCELEINRLRGA